MNSRDMSTFSPQEMKTFNSMSQAANARPAELPMASTDDMAAPELELADGGKVKGKGGPTDDKVGPVALSDGEYVLPADTVEIVVPGSDVPEDENAPVHFDETPKEGADAPAGADAIPAPGADDDAAKALEKAMQGGDKK